MVKEIFDRGTVRNVPINKYLVFNVFIAVGNNLFFFFTDERLRCIILSLDSKKRNLI